MIAVDWTLVVVSLEVGVIAGFLHGAYREIKRLREMIVSVRKQGDRLVKALSDQGREVRSAAYWLGVDGAYEFDRSTWPALDDLRTLREMHGLLPPAAVTPPAAHPPVPKKQA